jgi:hypothetical protein
MIKTVKLTKTHPVELTCINNVIGTSDIEYIQSYDFTLKWKISSFGDQFDNLDDLALAQNVTIHKIEHFVQNYLNNSIWFDANGLDMSNKHFAECENLLIITPDTNFTCLGMCLYAKLNALCKPGMVVTELYLEDVQLKQSFEYSDIGGESPDQLPTQDEFMGELALWQDPWWMRDDLSTYDSKANDPEDLGTLREQFDLALEVMRHDFNSIEEQVKEILFRDENAQAEVIELDFNQLKENSKWKPKLV